MTQEILKQHLTYDSSTGKFYYVKTKSGISDLTKEAGTIDNGYIRITINRKTYRAHHLAWLYVYGELPVGIMDHINHNRSDNRIENLRLTDHVGNSRNFSKMSTNKSGVTGVHWDKRRNKWEAQISINSTNKMLGRFDDFNDACTARYNAEILYGYHQNHGK